MNLSAEVVGEEGTTEGCCFSNSICSRFSFSSNNRQLSKEQSIGLKEIEEELQESTTAKEREHVTNEIIGSNVHEIAESEEFVARHLEKLEKELTKITGSIRSAYDFALKMNSKFVKDTKFRIMFLRADEFDAKKAARRIILHFKYKLGLFGKEKLVKEITFDDLSPTDQACLHTGSFQILSGVRDKLGRSVVFHFPEIEQIVSWEHSTRVLWYQFMVRMQQEELTQKLGVIIVCVGRSPPGILSIFLRRSATLSQSLPIRVAAYHKYLIRQKINPFLATTSVRAVSSKVRLRVQFHIEESVTSFLYNIFLYGIDPAKVPLDDDKKPQTETFFKFLEKQKLLERQQQQKQQQHRPRSNHITKKVDERREEEERKYRTTTTALECFHSDTKSVSVSSTATTSSDSTTKRVFVVPTRHDIILGKGLKNVSYEGNAVLNKMVEMEALSYKKATSQIDKSCIVLMTMKRIESIGGRFIKFCDDNNSSHIGSNRRNNKKEMGWILASDQEIRNTVGNRFRYKARKLKV